MKFVLLAALLALAGCVHTNPCPFDQFLVDPACH
jgi:hypothetical protein